MGTTPLVSTLQITSPEVRQVCLADDISGAGSLDNLIIWWKNVISEGKKFGYLVNEKKSWLILKDHGNLLEAQRLFSNTGIKLTTDDQRHRGAAIGTSNFRPQYAAEKVTKWCNELHYYYYYYIIIIYYYYHIIIIIIVLPTLQKHNRMQSIQLLLTVS